MLKRKPIIRLKNAENLDGFKYKYVRIGYVAGVPIEFYTDLSRKEFERFLDGGYTWKDVEKFEMTGKF